MALLGNKAIAVPQFAPERDCVSCQQRTMLQRHRIAAMGCSSGGLGKGVRRFQREFESRTDC